MNRLLNLNIHLDHIATQYSLPVGSLQAQQLEDGSYSTQWLYAGAYYLFTGEDIDACWKWLDSKSTKTLISIRSEYYR